MIDEQLAALASDTRRNVLLLLIERPRSVQDLADRLPVSRPAVSQHLKVLVDAGLATATRDGTRRTYAADPDGVRAIRSWTEQLWSNSLEGLRDLSPHKETAVQTLIEPVVKTLRTTWTPDEAFEVFTARMADWWPLGSHSVSEEEAATVAIEPRVGGHLVERAADGSTHTWGTVTEWEPGHRVAFTWHPGRDSESATHVEVRFRPLADGSELLLVHAGWEILGARASEVRAGYQTGWDLVLDRYRAA